ncbi:transposase [uncultured Nostoc sp.]|uniref:transposase n=1 Tax=uncultured Nostoc sp. TaxID=340711 RepID=UPI0035CB1C86
MEIVQSLLTKMGIFHKPQIKALTTLFATILIACGKVNFTNLSRYSQRTERSYRRQFKKQFDFAQFNAEVIKAATPENHSMIAVMDCSFIAKSGKKTFGLDQFYNGSHSRVERGLEVSLVVIVDVETEVGYGLLAEQTFDQDFCPDLTRMDYYLHHLEITQPQLPVQIRYLAVDGAYAKEPFVTGVVALNLNVISKLRRDANLRYVFEGEQKARGAKRKYDGKVNLADPTRLTMVSELPSGVELYTAFVWHVSFKRKIRLAYLLDHRNFSKPSYSVLFSTDINQSADEIYRFYKLRFQIEFIFRDAKQFTGLSDCQARDVKKLDFHFNASFAALNIAKLDAHRQQLGQKPFVFSMASVKRRALNDHLLDTFISKLGLSPTVIKFHPNYQNLRSYGVIAA